MSHLSLLLIGFPTFFAAFIISNHNVTKLLSMSVQDKQQHALHSLQVSLHLVYWSTVSCCLLFSHFLSLHCVLSLFRDLFLDSLVESIMWLLSVHFCPDLFNNYKDRKWDSFQIKTLILKSGTVHGWGWITLLLLGKYMLNIKHFWYKLPTEYLSSYF